MLENMLQEALDSLEHIMETVIATQNTSLIMTVGGECKDAANVLKQVADYLDLDVFTTLGTY